MATDNEQDTTSDTADLEAWLEADEDAFDALGATDHTEKGADAEVVDDAGDHDEPDATESAEEQDPAADTIRPNGNDDVPAWVQRAFEQQANALEALREQNARLEKLLEAKAAAPPAPPKEPTARDLMREALELDDDDPDARELRRAAAMAELAEAGEWEGDESAQEKVARARAFSKSRLGQKQSQRSVGEQLAETQAKLAKLERTGELRESWERLARGLPALADDENATQAFPHLRTMFRDPYALHGYVMEFATQSDESGQKVLGEALSDLEQKLGALDTSDPAAIKSVARYAAMNGKDGLSGALMAYAKALESRPSADDAATPPKQARPATPPGPAGGRVKSNKIGLEQYLEIDEMDDWSEFTKRAMRAGARN